MLWNPWFRYTDPLTVTFTSCPPVQNPTSSQRQKCSNACHLSRNRTQEQTGQRPPLCWSGRAAKAVALCSSQPLVRPPGLTMAVDTNAVRTASLYAGDHRWTIRAYLCCRQQVYHSHTPVLHHLTGHSMCRLKLSIFSRK